jgi:hypothetical protein
MNPALLDREDFSGSFRDAVEALRFMLAGNATLTLRRRATGTRYTYKVTRLRDELQNPRLPFPGDQKAVERAMLDAERKAPRYFVNLLSGPDNENDFVYLGMVSDNVFRLTRKSRMTSDSLPVKAFTWAFTKLVQRVMPEALEVWHEGRCGRCGRKLSVPESIAAGIGPECTGRMEG